MKNEIIKTIITLVNKFGILGVFHTTFEDWAMDCLLRGRKMPKLNYARMEALREKYTIGANTIEDITEDGIVIFNEETDNLMFLPYEALADEVLNNIVNLITASI